MIDHLYFVRHGQSTANAQGVYAGSQGDVQLTEHGRRQALAAGKLLKGRGITAIIASDLDRAQETARLIASAIDFPVGQIETDSRLREVNVGNLTGQIDTGFSDYLKYLVISGDSVAESPPAVASRLRPLLSDLAMRSGTVLLVAHAGIGRVLRAMLSEATIEEMATLDVPNAHPFDLPLDHLQEEAAK